MPKSLLVTFHASHNHGSALQAFATQKLLEQEGYPSTILNFQMPSQKKYYSLYGGRKGMKIRQLAMIPIHFQRKSRQQKFIDFQNNYFNMTKEYHSYDELRAADFSQYNVLVSGADQIWSNTIPEFVNSDVDFKGIYFGDFVSDIKKIAFASSTGEADIDYLKSQLTNLKQYQHIAVREERGRKLLNQLLDYKCDVVLDPTLLLTRKEYNKWFDLENALVKEEYIFLYTLQGVKSGRRWKILLQNLYEKTGLRIIVVSPFFPIYGKNITNINEAGPIEFLNLIYNAKIVLTDSFHGTAYSVNFRKNFFVYQADSSHDPRKKNLLNSFGLSNRIINKQESGLILNADNIDYSNNNKLIEAEIETSRNILKRYLKDISNE
ncbi:polysaccharide pyruvyl transferase family protein [Latilactobacillus curvatus]|uniref:polysaccharide pyruvyl transferase family protein n=1 Tax=Latilactobacillus curvatus TaxID=28038 RepID=UPI002D776D08|nr:polysaccharide pyruvyl transferase family protein [Latilactobacillus curvatus]WRS46840.1 polysaccharide pyruvyl transferase family protein [Latilactobacillus curvatus]